MEECTGKSTGCELRIIRAEAEVDARVAQCTLDAHRLDGPVSVGERGHADDSIQLEQCESRSTLPAAGCFFKASGHASASTLSPTDNAVLGEPPGPTPPFLAGNGLVQLQCITPEGLAAECVVAKGLFTLIKHRLRVAGVLDVDALLRGCSSEGLRLRTDNAGASCSLTAWRNWRQAASLSDGTGDAVETPVVPPYDDEDTAIALACQLHKPARARPGR